MDLRPTRTAVQGKMQVMDSPLGSNAVFSPATSGDAPEILVLQRCCWVSEALLNKTLDIPALHEDLETVREWIDTTTVLTARSRGRLVGAVRGASHGDTWQIGRLMVAPDWSGRGLGRALLVAAEEQAPAHTSHFELFTGGRSTRNIRMYERAGYTEQKAMKQHVSGHIPEAVYLVKPRHLNQ